MEVKLFASLRENRGKTASVEWREGLNGNAILESLAIPAESVAIYLINGKNADFNEPLSQSDVVSLFPPVGGG